jgi:hypothetical protein
VQLVYRCDFNEFVRRPGGHCRVPLVISFRLNQARYCSSLIFSIRSTALPSSFSTIAIMRHRGGRRANASCRVRTRSRRRAAFLLWIHPNTASSPSGSDDQACPRGWVCLALLAPGLKVTNTPNTRAGSGGSKRGSTRTEPVKLSAGPLREACEPLRLISIILHLDWS